MRNLHDFVGADSGSWRVLSIVPVRGESLPPASAVTVVPPPGNVAGSSQVWSLKAQISNLRYAERPEIDVLKSKQEQLGRPGATQAALIPIRKSAAWWDLAQDERRAIFEARSRHTAIGLDYLPAVSRQLYHCRDLGEPFDFLTWFEFAPDNANAFEDLVARLRATEEWRYVEREVDIRLERNV